LCEVLRPVVLADTLAAAIEAWRARREDGVEYRYVTLEGDVLDASGRITGGSPEKAGAGLLAGSAMALSAPTWSSLP
ncbi:MAG: hypothetical protein K6T59_05520, partial [Bryobacteraceae bacterium]|nr:hypothetical protein [Bryobacteraceae bacterium]